MSKFVLSLFLARKKGQEINRDWDKLIGFFRPPAAIKGSSKGAEFILTFALDKIEHVENAIWAECPPLQAACIGHNEQDRRKKCNGNFDVVGGGIRFDTKGEWELLYNRGAALVV